MANELRNNRVTAINCEDPKNVYFCTGSGNLYSYDIEEELIRTVYITPIKYEVVTKLVLTSNHVVGRDIWGTLIFWNRKTGLCEKTIRLSEIHSCQIDVEELSPLPSRTHGLVVHGKHIYTSNSYGELCRINTSNYEIEFFRNGNHGFYEYILGFDDQTLYTVNTSGELWKVDLIQMEAFFQGRFTSGATHKILHDDINKRLLIADDGFCGITSFDLESKEFKKFSYTYDDVEAIVFNADRTKIYMACFDHYIYELSNTEEPSVLKKIGPFKFQLTEMETTSDHRHTFVVLQSGEVFQVDLSSSQTRKIGNFGSDAVWEITLTDDSAVFAQESGDISIGQLGVTAQGIVKISELRSCHLPYGRVRRVKHHKKLNLLVSAHTENAVCITTMAGELKRKFETKGITRDISISPDGEHCAAIDESGYLHIFSLQSNAVKVEKVSHAPWACDFADNNTLVIGERFQNYLDDQGKLQVNSNLLFLDVRSNMEVMPRHPIRGSVKRIRRLDTGELLITGTNSIGTSVYSLAENRVTKTYNDWCISTTEDATIIGEYLYSVGYGFNLNTYHKSGELRDCQFEFVDRFPKTVVHLRAENKKFLLVGGRGGYLDCYLVDENGKLSKRSSVNLSHLVAEYDEV